MINVINIIEKLAQNIIIAYASKEMDSQIVLHKILDSIQSSSFEECKPKMIAHEKKSHQEFSAEQAVAVGIQKCKEKHGVK